MTIDLFAGAPSPSRLLVITHDDFVAAARTLVAHKNQTGMPAHLIRLSDIVGSIAQPAGHPFAIKTAIAEGHRRHGVYYVLLLGDASKIPVRHAFVRQSDGGQAGGLDGSYNPTDHYYANLYDPNTQAVATWDGNGDGIYNESTWAVSASAIGSPAKNNPDRVDGYPHVAVARVPAHTSTDAENYVRKVIDYELGLRMRSTPAMTFVCDQALPGSPEACDAMIADGKLEQLPAVAIDKLWANLGSMAVPWPNWRRFGSAASETQAMTAKWCVHVGHGMPTGWGITMDDGAGFAAGRVQARGPSHSLPVMFSVGCETGAYLNWAPARGPYRGLNPDTRHDFTFDAATKSIRDNATNQSHAWPLITPPPHPYDFPNEVGRTFAHACLCASDSGGAIAYAGASLVHQGGYYGQAFFTRVLRRIGTMNILGDAWVTGQRDYVSDNLYPDDIHGHARIYLSIQTLFGDPSLRTTPVLAYGVSAVMAGDRLTVFARTNHGTLTHKFYDGARGAWTDWVHLGEGQLSSAPSALMAGGRLTVFARDGAGRLTHKFWNGSAWTNWVPFDGEIASGPSAVMSGDRLVVFARSLAGRLTHRYYDAATQQWSGWIAIGEGTIASAPSAVMAGQRLMVFARRPDGTLGFVEYGPSGWTAWAPVVAGAILSAPTAVMVGERLTVFARTSKGTLTHTYRDGALGQWAAWQELGTTAISSGPAAVLAGSRLTVFARAQDGMLTHKFYDASKGWIDWYGLGPGTIT